MSDWMPSLNALRAFVATARHRSFVLAAEELCVTPSAVKQLVRKLEEALGRPLITREGRGLRVTPAGAAGLPHLARGFEEIARGLEVIRAEGGRRRLILSVEPSFATAWLVPRLERFRALSPEVDVLVDTTLALVDLRAGAADVAIRFGAAPDPGLVAHRLFDEALCAFCSPRLASGPGAVKRPEDIADVPLIHWDLSELGWARATRDWMGWTPWLRHLGLGALAREDGIRFRDYNLALQAAIAGQGLVLGSQPVLRDYLASGLLVQPFPDRVVTDIGYDAVTTPEALARPEVAAFLDWIRAEAALAQG
ncbi:LysR family transcriptional regulator [Pseudooceanicola sp. GBMRC 2024]|uniref:LysR family transcriptional regulator n=1 Tax=Pseudooceanicola albus TaxID=2692189 RepID=A0A6L7G2I1_9RHOB|nr:LysR substrate-binding domain-containing protein [Pseudooceanicola albus]MXN17912.1 LysR family transcriptional regulator [Pseudooceanicola albus]